MTPTLQKWIALILCSTLAGAPLYQIIKRH